MKLRGRATQSKKTGRISDCSLCIVNQRHDVDCLSIVFEQANICTAANAWLVMIMGGCLYYGVYGSQHPLRSARKGVRRTGRNQLPPSFHQSPCMSINLSVRPGPDHPLGPVTIYRLPNSHEYLSGLMVQTLALSLRLSEKQTWQKLLAGKYSDRSAAGPSLAVFLHVPKTATYTKRSSKPVWLVTFRSHRGICKISTSVELLR